MTKCKGIVYLAGAGPGDPRLITLRCLECLRLADIVVYDRLVNPLILAEARKDATLIYAGKLPDHHSMTQDKINDLLASKAQEGYVVLRLKGGDPFIFGRGGEEAEYLRERSISYEIIPGISSAIAAPAYAGIPLTYRDSASSFSVITGHDAPDTKKDAFEKWEKLSLDCDTLVFLMGMSRLEKIVEQLLLRGRDPHEPVSIIQWGTTQDQKTLTATLETVLESVRQSPIGSPAVIVVGQVAALGKRLHWHGLGPLSGKRIMITRPSPNTSGLSQLIRDLGGESWELPMIAIAPCDDLVPMQEALRMIHSYSWLAFTSFNSVQAFFNCMRSMKIDLRQLKHLKIAAIGSKTGLELEKRGLYPDYLPVVFTGQALALGLSQEVKPTERILMPRAENAPEAFDILREQGFLLDEVPAYKTIAGSPRLSLAIEMIMSGKIHALMFSSASTVEHFVSRMPMSELQEALDHMVICCIGPLTADKARSLGLSVDLIPSEHTVEGMLRAVSNYFNKEKSI
jgi:uroporphyrinogen III methyltransferase / synthase